MPSLSVVVVLLAVISAPVDSPRLLVLSDTGQKHNGLPVLTRFADADRYESVLLKGFSGTLVRLYVLEQRLTHPGRPPRPAYLVLTDNQGGFPRSGFELDGTAQTDTPFVDLHRRSDLTGRYGAIDQIFPHELMHIIIEDLAGRPPDGFASQVHAVAVQTDRATAFNEGLAETAQILAIDAPDAAADTRALALDLRRYAEAQRQFDAYARAMTARWNVGTRTRMTFPFWFSQSEQVLRYHAVRANQFSRARDVSDLAALRHRVYDAYLLENVGPGPLTAPPRTASRMVATEGVVAALFWRLLASDACRAAQANDEFYRAFDTTSAGVTSLENGLLKLFAAIRVGGYDTTRVIRAYRQLFPGEAAEVDAMLAEILLGQPLPGNEELWLRNAAFKNGRSLFDQFRAMPRAHTFDLNAATGLDLITVPGVDLTLASRILERAPFRSVDDLAGVPGVTPQRLQTFRDMRTALLQGDSPGEDSGGLTIKAIMKPYATRAIVLMAIASLGAALLYRLVRQTRWWRVSLNGVAVAVSGLLVGWTLDPGTGAIALLAPLLVFGVPSTAIRLWRTRSLREAWLVAGAWALASLVPAMIVRPI